jgi:hypothetical protein
MASAPNSKAVRNMERLPAGASSSGILYIKPILGDLAEVYVSCSSKEMDKAVVQIQHLAINNGFYCFYLWVICAIKDLDAPSSLEVCQI